MNNRYGLEGFRGRLIQPQGDRSLCADSWWREQTLRLMVLDVIRSQFQAVFDREFDREYLTGSGTGQPRGILASELA